MNVREAAVELECSAELVYKLCDRGKLGHTRIGFGRGRILISAEQLAAYRRSCEVLPVPDSDEPERRRERITGIPDLVGERLSRRRAR